MSPPKPHALECFAIAAPGLEPLVATEVRGLAALPVGEGGGAFLLDRIRAVRGGVEFRADHAGLAAVQLRARIASRVLVRLATFRATAFHELERAARKVEWGTVLPPGAPFALRVTCRKSRLYHSDAVAERVAGAVTRVVGGVWMGGDAGAATDDATDEAIDDATEDPPQLFVVRFDRDHCTISADASGALLHRRGYRLATAKAPMRETLAAALLVASRWDPAHPLLDPFCGSGTIPIEAAMIARRIPPGLDRRFAAEGWPSVPTGRWASARDHAGAGILPKAPAPILGSDRDTGAVEAARANAERAGVAGDVEFRRVPLAGAAPEGAKCPPGRGWLVSNPPYGIRVGEADALRPLYAALGDLVRTSLQDWNVTLVTADEVMPRWTGLPFRRVLTTRNGGIPVEFVSRA